MSDGTSTPFVVAKLCYRPWEEHCWYVIRYGEIIDQGGSHIGGEGVGFASLQEATRYIEICTQRDLDTINKLIAQKQLESCT